MPEMGDAVAGYYWFGGRDRDRERSRRRDEARRFAVQCRREERMAGEHENPKLELVRPEIVAAFDAAYKLGLADGARYGVNSEGDAPDLLTRRREWLSRHVA